MHIADVGSLMLRDEGKPFDTEARKRLLSIEGLSSDKEESMIKKIL